LRLEEVSGDIGGGGGGGDNNGRAFGGPNKSILGDKFE